MCLLNEQMLFCLMQYFVNRYLSVYTNNWSDKFNYIVCNDSRTIPEMLLRYLRFAPSFTN